MVCTKCNHRLPDDSEFCQYCGSKLEASTIESDDNKAEVKEEPLTEEVIIPTTDNETVAKILASGIIEGQKAMEANKESQLHNELDADFGLVPQKPVYTVGIDEQEKYLKSLRTINGEPVKWNRRGSMSVDGVNGMVDVYDTYLPSGEEYKTIYINMYGAYNSTFAPKGFSYSAVATLDTKKSKSKKTKRKIKKSYLIIAIVLLIGLIAGGLAIGFSVYHNGLYEELSDKMLEIDYYNYNSNNIAGLINRLPSNYKDVKDIENQYKQIDKQIKIIENAERLNERDSEKVREAYVTLYKFNSQNDNWDLSEYLDGVLENSFSKFVFGKEWEDSDYFFQWYENGEGDGERLLTNLPNNKDDNKDYYFYYAYSDGSGFLNPRQFGYQNVNNSSYKFLAYRITDISYTGSKWQIKIYCYSNSRTYTLN